MPKIEESTAAPKQDGTPPPTAASCAASEPVPTEVVSPTEPPVIAGTAVEASASEAPTSDVAPPAEAEAVAASAAARPVADATAVKATADDAQTSRNADVDFKGQKRTNATHASTTDPEARLYRKGLGKEARLSFMGHALTENRHGLVVGTSATLATGTAEREAALTMLDNRLACSVSVPCLARVTCGAEKGYDVAQFVADLRTRKITPHVAQKMKGSAIDGRTTRRAGYAVSQRRRKLVEEPFGWAKTIRGLARPMLKGVARIGIRFTFTMAGYNLVHLPKLFAGRIASAAATPAAA